MIQRRIFIQLLLCAVTASAGSIKVSFLNETQPLEDTLSILRRHGCASNAVAAYQKAICHYYSTPFEIDLRGFPEQSRGFYTFKTPEQFVAALPRRLCDIEHSYEVNCFIPVVSLSGLWTATRPDDLVGPLLAILNRGGQKWDTCTVACTRDAFLAQYGPDYAKEVEAITGSKWTDQQICLLASLHTCHVLPRSTTEVTLPINLLAVLQSRWRQEGVHFPTNSDVTLLHSIDLKRWCRSLTDHAGIGFPMQHGYMYLEKAGGQGPFVRIDLEDPVDLIPYYRSYITEESKGEMTHWMMTVNDSKAICIEPQSPPPD